MRSTFETPSRDSTKSRMSPTKIGPWPSPTSRRRPNTMTSSFLRRHGAISAFVRKPIARKPPPKPLRRNASAERSKGPASKPPRRASGNEGDEAAYRHLDGQRRFALARSGAEFALQPIGEGRRQSLHPPLQGLLRQRLIGRAR